MWCAWQKYKRFQLQLAALSLCIVCWTAVNVSVAITSRKAIKKPQYCPISRVLPQVPVVDISSAEVAEAAVLHLCDRSHPGWTWWNIWSDEAGGVVCWCKPQTKNRRSLHVAEEAMNSIVVSIKSRSRQHWEMCVVRTASIIPLQWWCILDSYLVAVIRNGSSPFLCGL